MGCLLGCFGGGRKNRRRQRRRETRLNKISEEGSSKDVHLNLSVPIVEQVSKDDLKVPAFDEVSKLSVIPTTTDVCDKKAEENNNDKNSPSPSRKRVTFDSKVKTYEHVAVEEKKEEEEFKPLKSSQTICSSEGSHVTSSSSDSYPANHRYKNCRESDDEEEDDDVTDYEESDLDDLDDEDYDDDYVDKHHTWDAYTEEITDNVLDIEKKTKTSVRDRSGYANAVLNPIENLTQWKAVKSRGKTHTQSLKQNVNLKEPRFDDELPSFSIKQKPRDETKKHRAQEVAVDASLSTWLTTSQTSGCSSVSTVSKRVQSYDERPILGALTSEEIKQFSAMNSPRKSPSRSPESPIIGTVGGYWNNHSMATL